MCAQTSAQRRAGPLSRPVSTIGSAGGHCCGIDRRNTPMTPPSTRAQTTSRSNRIRLVDTCLSAAVTRRRRESACAGGVSSTCRGSGAEAAAVPPAAAAATPAGPAGSVSPRNDGGALATAAAAAAPGSAAGRRRGLRCRRWDLVSFCGLCRGGTAVKGGGRRWKGQRKDGGETVNGSGRTAERQ